LNQVKIKARKLKKTFDYFFGSTEEFPGLGEKLKLDKIWA
jgi:hypothetical protein